MSAEWIAIVLTALALLVTVLTNLFGNTSRGQAANAEKLAAQALRISAAELKTESLGRHVAEHYATKHELREAVADLKENINGRFDRLENKLEQREREPV